MEWVDGADISHFQGRPDFDRLVDDGIRWLVIKATQGLAVDADFEWNRNEAAKRNLPVFCYPFLMPDDSDAVISHFIALVGQGAAVALDFEKAGTHSTVVERWMDRCEAELGRRGMLYRGKWPPAPITPRMLSWPWWYAQYPSNPDSVPRIPLWNGAHPPDWSAECLAWQWTGSGRLPEIATAIDLDRVHPDAWVGFQAFHATGVFPDSPGRALVTPEIVTIPHPVRRTLQLHATGGDVLSLQRALVGRGYDTGGLDGEYGHKTQIAVSRFQQTAGIVPVDGIAGPMVLKALGL